MSSVAEHPERTPSHMLVVKASGRLDDRRSRSVEVLGVQEAGSRLELRPKSSVAIDINSSRSDHVSQGDKMCRICYGGGPEDDLRSLCSCRGSVGLVHKACLEAWLSSSGLARCELCGFQFRLNRVPRHSPPSALWLWLTTVADRTQMLVDLVWFCLMTPFAALSGYLIYGSLARYKELVQLQATDASSPGRNEPIMLTPVLIMSCFTVAIYYAWAVAIVQFHTRRWYHWWLTTFVVTVLEPPAASVDEGQAHVAIDIE